MIIDRINGMKQNWNCRPGKMALGSCSDLNSVAFCSFHPIINLMPVSLATPCGGIF